jgi:predicted alpha/beta-fold hydrolase
MGEVSSYVPPFFLFNAHLETIFPSLLRRVFIVPYTRERIDTPDNDFLDLDWIEQHSKKLVIISHGLEGNTTRPYVKGMAKAFHNSGFDVLAWNYRGCSEEMNRQLRFYHSGATDDLDVVVRHAIAQNRYEEINLVGFSLGGNLTLKYLGERNPHDIIHKAVAFSAPIHLQSSCEKISTPSNRIYAQRFLRSLKNKILVKSKLIAGLDTKPLPAIKTIQQFDDTYTAPIHGYKTAAEYYERNSSLYFLKTIVTPTLIVNTQNDPFLSQKCFPIDEVKGHPVLRMEIPLRGGHVGFTAINKKGLYWSEERAVHWVLS